MKNKQLQQVIEAISDNPRDIALILREGNEYYFQFRHVYFSCVRLEADGQPYYKLFVFPQFTGSLPELASRSNEDSSFPVVAFDSRDETQKNMFAIIPWQMDINERDPFPNLYHALEQRHFGISDIFDRVLKNQGGE